MRKIINLHHKPAKGAPARYVASFYTWNSIIWLLKASSYKPSISFNPSSKRVEVILESIHEDQHPLNLPPLA